MIRVYTKTRHVDSIHKFLHLINLEHEIFTTKNLTTKRPGNGLSPMLFNQLLGKGSEKNFKENDKIRVRKILIRKANK